MSHSWRWDDKRRSVRCVECGALKSDRTTCGTPRRFTPEEIDRAVEMHVSRGLSRSQIARLTGRERHAVGRHLRARGVS